jgi:hypothetical protein
VPTTDQTTFYAQKYEANLRLLAQQMEPRLSMAAMQGNHAGSKAAVAIEQLGPITVDQRTTRFAPITLSDVNHYRRWVYMTPFNKNIGFDDLDGIQMLQDPKGQYVTSMRAALNRKMDYAMIHAFFATANVGQTATDTAAFTAGNIVPVNFEASGNTGLTVAKLIEAKRILKAAEVDLDYEPVYCAIGAKQEANLFHEIQITNSDYSSSLAPLVEGKISKFLGINFIHTEQLFNDPTYAGVPLWVPSGMHYGTWLDVGVSVDRRIDLEWQPWQASIKAAFGAVRLEETKVIEILCA